VVMDYRRRSGCPSESSLTGGTRKGLPPVNTTHATAGRGGLKAEGPQKRPLSAFPRALLARRVARRSGHSHRYIWAGLKHGPAWR
jgi:hypothetical protein